MTSVSVKIEHENFDIECTPHIAAVLSDWERLEKEGQLTPFQTRAWLRPFYEILAPHLKATPLFILVRDKQSQQPLMLLPLCSKRHYGIDIITFADLGVSDYNAPLIAKSFHPTRIVWNKLWRTITTLLDRGSFLKLEKMPFLIDDHPNPLAQYHKRSMLMDISSWGVTLPSTFTQYTQNILNPTFAKELVRKGRRVSKRGDIEYGLVQTVDDKEKIFEILVRQRQARCDEMRRSNILSYPIYRRFYEAVAVTSPEALGRLTMFKVGSIVVGTILALNHKKALYVIMSTFEGGEWKSSSLGNVVMQTAIDYAIRDGIQFFDFTIGNEGYKQHFGAVPTSLYSVVQPLTCVGFLITFMINFGKPMKVRLKKLVLSIAHKMGKGADKNAYT